MSQEFRFKNIDFFLEEITQMSWWIESTKRFLQFNYIEHFLISTITEANFDKRNLW